MTTSLASALAALAMAIGMMTGPSAAAAQPGGTNAAPDTVALRRDLARVLGSDFTIARHELSRGTPERSGLFWLVHVRPRQAGDFGLEYRYRYTDPRNPRQPHFTTVRHRSTLRIGERGCRRHRWVEGCVGDTIILPFVIDGHTRHQFALQRHSGRPTADRVAAETPSADDVVPITNPAGDVLEYLGTEAQEHQYRNGGSSWTLTARFRARAPGRLNLSLGPRLPEDAPRAENLDAGSPSIPVLVVPRGRAVTTLRLSEEVVGTDEVRNFTSNGGIEYGTTLHLLQPGDTLEVSYLAIPRPRNWRTEPVRPSPLVTAQAGPVIRRARFRLSANERFNAWLIPWLPR